MRLFDLFTDNMTPNWDVFEKTFPEMATCKHSERWHKEGSPLEHTKLVTKEMYNRVKDGKYSVEDSLVLMSAAMLHDIGKPLTTYWDEKKNDWSCKAHGADGERLFREVFYEEIADIREKVAYMIRYHMMLRHIMEKDENRQEEEIVQLMNGTVGIDFMLLLNECDMRGSINEENEETFIREHFSNMNEVISKVAKKEWVCNPWRYVNIDTPRAYVMIGIPGSGKSTFAQEIQADYLENGINIPIISRDTIRAEIGLCKNGEKCVGNKDEEKSVTKIFDEKIRSQVNSFIVDNTSLKRKYRNGYCAYARNYNFAPIYVYVEAPSIDDNIARRYGQIDESVIRRMWNDLEFPNLSECYELWIVSQRDGKTNTYVFRH